MTGVSQRTYARLRGVSMSAVQKAIASKRITLNPDGTIDPERANEEWERNTFAGKTLNQATQQATRPHVAPLGDPAAHLDQRPHAVSFTEGFPRQRDGKVKEFRKEAASGDPVLGCVELEKHEFAGLQRLERHIRRWPPKIDLLHVLPGAVESEPFVVGDAAEEVHLVVDRAGQRRSTALPRPGPGVHSPDGIDRLPSRAFENRTEDGRNS